MSILYSSPLNKSKEQRAQFARQMMLEEFGYRYGRAIDQADFQDRAPDELPPPADEFLDWIRLVGVEATR